MLAPTAGFYDPDSYTANAVDVALFVLFLGGFLGVVGATGAIDTGTFGTGNVTVTNGSTTLTVSNASPSGNAVTYSYAGDFLASVVDDVGRGEVVRAVQFGLEPGKRRLEGLERRPLLGVGGAEHLRRRDEIVVVAHRIADQFVELRMALRRHPRHVAEDEAPQHVLVVGVGGRREVEQHRRVCRGDLPDVSLWYLMVQEIRDDHAVSVHRLRRQS